jgi:hypothetical protein
LDNHVNCFHICVHQVRLFAVVGAESLADFNHRWSVEIQFLGRVRELVSDFSDIVRVLVLLVRQNPKRECHVDLAPKRGQRPITFEQDFLYSRIDVRHLHRRTNQARRGSLNRPDPPRLSHDGPGLATTPAARGAMTEPILQKMQRLASVSGRLGHGALGRRGCVVASPGLPVRVPARVGALIAIRVLADLCLGIIFRLGHLRLPTNPIQMTSPGPSTSHRRVGALTYSSNRASNGIQVDQGVARKAK